MWFLVFMDRRLKGLNVVLDRSWTNARCKDGFKDGSEEVHQHHIIRKTNLLQLLQEVQLLSLNKEEDDLTYLKSNRAFIYS